MIAIALAAHSAPPAPATRAADLRARLVERIRTSGIVRRDAHPTGAPEPFRGNWIADIKTLLLDPAFISDLAEFFLAHFAHLRTFNVAALELGAIPLAVAIAAAAHQQGLAVRPLVVRKSRNKKGLRRVIEGAPLDAPTVMVDDVLNTGSSAEVLAQKLRAAGLPPFALFVVLSFERSIAQAWCDQSGVPIIVLTTTRECGIQYNEPVPAASAPHRYIETARYTTPHAAFEHVCPKSAPVLTSAYVLFGADRGRVLCLDKTTAAHRWTFQTRNQRKGVWSTPTVYGNNVFFGGYDGIAYRLDINTGAVVWASQCADYIGGTIAVDDPSQLAIVGCEHDLDHARGSIAALDLASGDIRWRHGLRGYTHSPGFHADADLIIAGSNDGELVALSASTGRLLWSIFLESEIKHRPVIFNAARGGVGPVTTRASQGDLGTVEISTGQLLVAVPSCDGALYILDALTGERLRTICAEAGIFASPLVDSDIIIFTSADQNVYRACITTGQVEGRFDARARIFSEPALINGRIVVGTNAAVMHELDPTSLNEIGRHVLSDRITSKVTHDPTTDLLYVHTGEDHLHILRPRNASEWPALNIVSPSYCHA
jgi:outer membrane protein assembly factor BamB